MSPHDDPRLTAHALGALDEAERAEVEALLAADPEALGEVEALREVAGRVRAALDAEPLSPFPAARRAEVEARARAPRPRGRRFALLAGGAAAAALLLGVVLPASRFTALRARESGAVPGAGEDRTREAPGFTMYAGDGDNAKHGLAPSAKPMFQVGPDKVVIVEGAQERDVESMFRGEAPSSTEAYDALVEEGYKRPAQDPLSTFSIDVDTASYANVRRFLNGGSLPPPGAVRIEEMVNYFRYAYEAPRGPVPFAVHLEATQCPWALDHRLVRIGIKGREIDLRERPPSNLVFLLDVSGSMGEPNKLPLVRDAMRLLVEGLQAADRVSIVVYAGASGLVLPPTGGDRKAEILAAIDSLSPGGSTNGAAGIELAYRTAEEALLKGGNNRVVLCTDGDFNVGVTSQDELVRLIEAKAKSGVFLTALGFGMGNYKDSTLERLADKGNGNYGYVDSLREARRLLVEDATGTLFTIAKDVKVQVEWNPAQVAGYRLIGYENRRLAAEDFNDDAKDAGEIGAGHTVTALYEVIPAGGTVPGASVDPLKYQDRPAGPPSASRDLLTLKMRWKAPDGDVSDKIETPLVDAGLPYDRASDDTKFAAAVAAFAMILRDSAWKGTASFEGVLELGGEAVGADPGGYRAEFLDLVRKARSLR